MSSPLQMEVLGLSLIASDSPRDYAALADAILAFYKAVDRPARWYTVLARDGKVKQRVFRVKSFLDTCLDDATLSFHVGTDDDANEHVIGCFLRPHDVASQEFETRFVSLTGTGLAWDDKPVQALLAALVALYPISQGGIAGYRSLRYAAKECSFSGSVSSLELDAEARERLGTDQMLSGRFLKRLRRLYPITLIGPAIGAELPPIPNVEPAPVVEELGSCKLLRAWPTLVEPRDTAFLAGTTELRRWLWPYTIKNPADVVEPTA